MERGRRVAAEISQRQFFQRGRVKSGTDEVRGQYIQFNGATETYLVTNGPNATTIPSQQGRVQVTIQPKKKDGTTP